MAVRVDRMTMDDVPEVMAIERESFAGYTPWPGSAYKRELSENRNAHYLALRLDDAERSRQRTGDAEAHVLVLPPDAALEINALQRAATVPDATKIFRTHLPERQSWSTQDEWRS